MTANGAFEHWIDRPYVDWLIGFVAGVAVGVAIKRCGGISISDHTGFYATLVGLSLGLLSLGAVVVTLIATVTPTARLRRLVDDAGDAVIRLMFKSLLALGASGLLFLLPWILESSLDDYVLAGYTTGVITVVTLNAVRLLWLLDRVVVLAMQGSDD